MSDLSNRNRTESVAEYERLQTYHFNYHLSIRSVVYKENAFLTKILYR